MKKVIVYQVLIHKERQLVVVTIDNREGAFNEVYVHEVKSGNPHHVMDKYSDDAYDYTYIGSFEVTARTFKDYLEAM